MYGTCPKCKSSEILAEIPVVTSKGFAVAALDYNHRVLARVCGSCGFAEFYIEDPKGLVAAVAKQADAGT